MKSFILLTVLNSAHGNYSPTHIRVNDIKALRAQASGCAISHKDFEEEILVKESCAAIDAMLVKPKSGAKSGKKKGAQAWFQ